MLHRALTVLRPSTPTRALLDRGRVPVRRPTYVRAVVTARCPLACSYCHLEGDPAVPGLEHGLSTREWIDLLSIAVAQGARKIKFLGGEPLVRLDLPQIVAALRANDADLDLSVITSGAVPVERIDRLYAAGLSRCNVSIHGFGPEAFHRRTGRGEAQRRARDTFLEAVLDHGRPLKTNYVYTGVEDDADLAAFLAFAARRSLLVNVLDDLGRTDLDARVLEQLVIRLRGQPAARRIEPDPHSLATTRLHWADGLEVELKHERLGEVAPWRSCEGCAERPRCKEGIHAIRIGHTGDVRPCMDRPDLGFPLAHTLRSEGVLSAATQYRVFVSEVAR